MTKTKNEELGEKPWHTRYSDGILVAAVPLFSYVVVFVYQSGYFNYFKIPLQFISFKLNEIFISITSLIILIGIWNWIEGLSIRILPKNLTPQIAKRIRPFIFLLSLLSLLLLLYPNNKEYWQYSFLSLVIIALYEFLFPLYKMRKIKSNYSKKLEKYYSEQERKKEAKTNKTTLDYIFQRMGISLTQGFIVLLFLFLGIYSLGHLQAVNQKNYYVIDQSEKVILYVGTDTFIVASFNRTTKVVEKNISIINTNSDPPLYFRSESIGPLISQYKTSP